mmetsp:Transcript_16433/g.49674  ORF Transcript_16433/g.49674 Transcript_16433/m.49674 type:complete len:362 (+) Transcript_16433:176-1261(+)
MERRHHRKGRHRRRRRPPLTRRRWLAVAALLSEASAYKLTVKLCSEEEEARDGLFTLLTSVPFVGCRSKACSNPHPHYLEALLAVAENSKNGYIEEIRVLVDRFAGPGVLHSKELDDNATAALRDEIARNQADLAHRMDVEATALDLTKVTAHVFGEQPTSAQLFRYASYALSRRVVLLTNADVVFRNLNFLDGSAFLNRQFVLAFAVRKPTGNFAATCADLNVVIDRCDNLAWSFDAFAFYSPLVASARWDLLEELSPQPVYMNDNAAEHRVNSFLLHSGYAVYQPCLYNFTEHWHCQSKMHHTKGEYSVAPVDGGEAAYRGMGKIKPTLDFPGLRCGRSALASELHESLLPDNWRDIVN